MGRAVWPTPLHKQLRPCEPHSSVEVGAPSGHPGAQTPPGRAELSRGLEAEPDLTPALTSPALHRNIVGPDCVWGCCWSWAQTVARREAPVHLAVTRRAPPRGVTTALPASSPLIGSCLSHMGREGAPPFLKSLGKGHPAPRPPGPVRLPPSSEPSLAEAPAQPPAERRLLHLDRAWGGECCFPRLRR